MNRLKIIGIMCFFNQILHGSNVKANQTQGKRNFGALAAASAASHTASGAASAASSEYSKRMRGDKESDEAADMQNDHSHKAQIKELCAVFPSPLIALILNYYGKRDITSLLFDHPIESCSISSDGKRLAVRTAIAQVEQEMQGAHTVSSIFYVRAENELHATKVATRHCSHDSALISGDGSCCVIMCEDGVEIVKDGVAGSKTVPIPSNRKVQTYGVDFTGSRIAMVMRPNVGEIHGMIDVCDVASGTSKTIVDRWQGDTSVAFSPSGHFLAVTSGFPRALRDASPLAPLMPVSCSMWRVTDNKELGVVPVAARSVNAARDDGSCLSASVEEADAHPSAAQRADLLHKPKVAAFTTHSKKYRVPLAVLPHSRLVLSAVARRCLVPQPYNRAMIVDLEKDEHEDLSPADLGCASHVPAKAWAVADTGAWAFAQEKRLVIARPQVDLHAILLEAPK